MLAKGRGEAGRTHGCTRNKFRGLHILLCRDAAESPDAKHPKEIGSTPLPSISVEMAQSRRDSQSSIRSMSKALGGWKPVPKPVTNLTDGDSKIE